MNLRTFLRFYVASALLGSAGLWTVACSSTLLAKRTSFAPEPHIKQSSHIHASVQAEAHCVENGPPDSYACSHTKQEFRDGAAWKDTQDRAESRWYRGYVKRERERLGVKRFEDRVQAERTTSGLVGKPSTITYRGVLLVPESSAAGIKLGRHLETLAPWRGDFLDASRFCNVPVRLLAALVARESNFDPWALSSANARGLTQIKPSTAAELGEFDLWNPAQNLVAGSCTLRRMIDRRRGNVRAALMDYVGGPNRARTTALHVAYADSILGQVTN